MEKNSSSQNPDTEIPVSDSFCVTYRTHVQTYGWQDWKKNGEMSGTSGQAKRLEGINIRLINAPYSGGIMYRTHVQTYGWQNWKYNGDMSGTSGKAKRLEGIEIKLIGEMANYYDVVYRTHVQTYGWQEWKKNGEMSGTSGQAKRLEGIEIKLVAKQSGTEPPPVDDPVDKGDKVCQHEWATREKEVWVPPVYDTETYEEYYYVYDWYVYNLNSYKKEYYIQGLQGLTVKYNREDNFIQNGIDADWENVSDAIQRCGSYRYDYDTRKVGTGKMITNDYIKEPGYYKTVNETYCKKCGETK